MIEILNRYTKTELYSSAKEILSEAVIDAVRSGAELRGADLRGADLSGADLSGATLPDGMSIMQVIGTAHGIVALHTPDGCEVRIGWEHHPLEWWREHYKAVGRKQGYTAAQIKEYGAHLVYVAWWAKHQSKLKAPK